MSQPAKRINRLATRASILYLGIPALTLILLSGIGFLIFRAIADDSAQRLARQYSIEAAGNFLAATNSHFVLAQQLAHSTTISRWMVYGNNEEIRARAIEEIMGYAAFAPYIFLMFTSYITWDVYDLRVGFTEDDFIPWWQIEAGALWFFNTRDALLPFNINIQRSRPVDGNFNVYVWTNHRMYYENRFVGVVTAGSPFQTVFDAIFGDHDIRKRRGYIIDYNGLVRVDSAELLKVLDDGLSHPAVMPEAVDNPILAERINLHLQTMVDGAFRLGREVGDPISLQGDFRYASIAPIVGTNWSVVVLSNSLDIFTEARYMPLVFSAFVLLIFSVIIGSTMVRRSVLVPLYNLTQSAAKAASVTGKTNLFGLERNDEIGDLARTIQLMRDGLKNALEETQRMKFATEKQRRKTAEEESRSKTRFLANMSHEIRTPMNAVLGIAEIQLQNQSHQPKTEEAFLRIYSSAKFLLTIINDILDLSKIESGKMEIMPVVYETVNLISDTVQFNMMHVSDKKIAFVIDVDERLPACFIGDEIRIKQVLNNLLSNAFKYTESGQVSLSFGMEEVSTSDPEVSVATDPEIGDVMLVIRVSDTGQGMTTSEIENLFKREFTRFNVKGNRAIEGSGLGMSIAYSFVTMMQGDIKVESILGQGSTFTVYLPQKIKDGRAIGKEVADSLCRLETMQKFSKKPDKFTLDSMPYGRVLVVDDVDINLYVAEGILTSYDISVDMAYSGHEAIDKIKSGEVYDIIFMDHMMPGMNGLETTKIIRGMGYDHPVVALTANAFKDSAKMFMSNGFSGFISKPIDIDKLNVYLERFILDKHAAIDAEAEDIQKKKSGSRKTKAYKNP